MSVVFLCSTQCHSFCGRFRHEVRVFLDQIQMPVRAPIRRNMNTRTMNTAVLGVLQVGQSSPMGDQLGREWIS